METKYESSRGKRRRKKNERMSVLEDEIMSVLEDEIMTHINLVLSYVGVHVGLCLFKIRNVVFLSFLFRMIK